VCTGNERDYAYTRTPCGFQNVNRVQRCRREIRIFVYNACVYYIYFVNIACPSSFKFRFNNRLFSGKRTGRERIHVRLQTIEPRTSPRLEPFVFRSINLNRHHHSTYLHHIVRSIRKIQYFLLVSDIEYVNPKKQKKHSYRYYFSSFRIVLRTK